MPRTELLEVVRRVSQLAQRNAALRMSFAEGELVVSAETPDLGDAREGLPAPYSGELLEIGFNPEFVRDGLESIDDDEVVVKLISPLRPGLLEPAELRRLQLPRDADPAERLGVGGAPCSSPHSSHGAFATSPTPASSSGPSWSSCTGRTAPARPTCSRPSTSASPTGPFAPATTAT